MELRVGKNKSLTNVIAPTDQHHPYTISIPVVLFYINTKRDEATVPY